MQGTTVSSILVLHVMHVHVGLFYVLYKNITRKNEHQTSASKKNLNK